MSFSNLKKFFRKRYRNIFGTSVTGTTAAQIRAMREKKGWSQQQLAQEVGMGQARISVLENPNYRTLSLSTLKRIANIFDVALIVRFVPFSKLFELLDNETESTLAVASFEDEFGTEANPIITPDAKLIDLSQRLRELHQDSPREGAARLKPDLLYDPKRAAGISEEVLVVPSGMPLKTGDAYNQPALGESQYRNILETSHPIGASDYDRGDNGTIKAA